MPKKRDKDYSFEEAMFIARQEAIPLWSNSEPLLASGVDEEGKFYPQPLSESLRSGSWALFFCAATGWNFPRVHAAYSEWLHRFSGLGMKSIFIFRERIPLFSGRGALEGWLERNHILGPAAADPDGSLNAAFAPEAVPRLVILHDGVVAFVGSGSDFLKGAERELHRLLRLDSPGLPLQLPWREPTGGPRERGHLAIVTEGVPTSGRGLVTSGRWITESDHLWTQDPDAKLRIVAPESDLAIVAESRTDGSSSTRISVAAVSTEAIPEASLDRDAFHAGDGEVTVTVHRARSYFLLRKLPAAYRSLEFGFPTAAEVPIKIYGFEFASTAAE